MNFLRGRIYLARHPDLPDGVPKYFVLVSSNDRRLFNNSEYLGLRITSTNPKISAVSKLRITPGESKTGYVICQEFYVLFKEDFVRDEGAFSHAFMQEIENSMMTALGIRKAPAIL